MATEAAPRLAGALAALLALGGCAGAAVPPEETSAGAMARGHALMAGGRPEPALRAFRQAALLGAGTDALASMGTANLALGRLGQAERILRRAVQAEPGSAPAWNNLGALLLETDRPDEAAGAFRRALALRETPELRENLALAEARAAEARAVPDTTTPTETQAAAPGRPAAPR